jgi:hypothetical protein
LVSVQWLVPETYWNVNPFWKTTEGEGAHGIFALSVWHGHLAWSFFPSTSPEVVVLSPAGNTDRRDGKSNSSFTFARRTLFGSDYIQTELLAAPKLIISNMKKTPPPVPLSLIHAR